MNLEELKYEKSKLESELAIEVSKLVEVFHKKTGVSIEGVSVYMSCVTAHGDSLEQYIVSGVSCDIAL